MVCEARDMWAVVLGIYGLQGSGYVVCRARDMWSARLGICGLQGWGYVERIKCLIFDDEMCTLQKVGVEDSKGRRVL